MTRMLGAGVDVATAASITGHTPQVLLSTYAHVLESRRRDAVAALTTVRYGPDSTGILRMIRRSCPFCLPNVLSTITLGICCVAGCGPGAPVGDGSSDDTASSTVQCAPINNTISPTDPVDGWPGDVEEMLAGVGITDCSWTDHGSYSVSVEYHGSDIMHYSYVDPVLFTSRVG